MEDMLRRHMLSLLGPFPSVVDVVPIVEQTKDKGTYDLMVVSYAVEEGERVRSLLLVPHGVEKPAPAVIACHQHGGRYEVGKSEPVGLCREPANTFALRFCNAGYVVLCPDFIGFEDRLPDDGQDWKIDGESHQRWLAMEYLLHGKTLQAKCLSDLSRALDVLQSFPFVDADRLGVCGHSYGGQEALWLGWYDRRIKAIGSSCGFSLIADLQRARINHNFAMYVPGFLTAGDMDDLAASLCPKPLYLAFGNHDAILPIAGVKRCCSHIRQVYADACASLSCVVEYTEAGHVFLPETQDRMIAFFDGILG